MQREGYVWFLPGWYDLDKMAEERAENEDGEAMDAEESLTNLRYLPDCSTAEMLQVLDGQLQV